jgi:hypothetical protein
LRLFRGLLKEFRNSKDFRISNKTFLLTSFNKAAAKPNIKNYPIFKVVLTEDARQFADLIGIKLFETSAKVHLPTAPTLDYPPVCRCISRILNEVDSIWPLLFPNVHIFLCELLTFWYPLVEEENLFADTVSSILSSDPYSHWVQIQLSQWIRIRIQDAQTIKAAFSLWKPEDSTFWNVS